MVNWEINILFLPIAVIAIAFSLKHLCDFVRAIRYHQWKANRDSLTLEQYIQSLECEYYKAFIKELYKHD
jgi:hypothetical protein